MATNDVDGYRYFSCAMCFGHWIPGRVTRRVLREPFAVRASGNPARHSAIACPACARPLEGLTVQACELDVCPTCSGLWLDGHEIVKLEPMFADGSQIVSSARDWEREPRSPSEFVLAEGIGGVIEFLFTGL